MAHPFALIGRAIIIHAIGTAIVLGSGTAPAADDEQTRQLIESVRAQQEQLDAQQRLILRQMEQLQQQQRELEELRRVVLSGAGRRAGALESVRARGPAPAGGSLQAGSAAAGSEPPAPPVPGRRPAAGRRPPAPATPAPASGTSAAPPAAAPATVAQAPAGQSQAASAEASASADRAPPQQPEAIEAINPEASVLTRPGSVIVEPSLDFSYSNQQRVLIEGFTVLPALTIGVIDVRSVQRNNLTAAVTLRTGILNRWEVEARIPFVYRQDTTTGRNLTSSGLNSQVDEVVDTDGAGLGDIELATRYQLTSGTGSLPLMIAGLRYKTTTGRSPFEVPLDRNTGLELQLPTGTGFNSLQPSLTFILPADPVVIFGSLNYTWNMPTKVRLQNGVEAEIDPGSAIGASIGMGFSVNENVSFSLGYEHNFVFDQSQNGHVRRGTGLQVGALQFGLGYRVSDAISANLQISAGLTDGAPDTRIVFRLPIKLDLF